MEVNLKKQDSYIRIRVNKDLKIAVKEFSQRNKTCHTTLIREYLEYLTGLVEKNQKPFGERPAN